MARSTFSDAFLPYAAMSFSLGWPHPAPTLPVTGSTMPVM